MNGPEIENIKQVNIVSILVLLVTIYAVFVPIPSALADDTMARVAAGGITFVKSEDVRMLKEILEISTKEIRVRFTFLNESPKDIHATVAFPMPPTRATEHWNVEKRLLETFAVRVNGRSVQTTVVRKAVIAGKDVTAQLRALGLSDKQIFQNSPDKSSEVIQDLTSNQRASLKKLGGDPEQSNPWNITVTMVWHQTFPAGKEVMVEHSYAPIVGAVYTVPFADGRLSQSSLIPLPPGKAAEACLDETTRQGIKNQVKACTKRNPEQVFVTLHHVEYILGTGRNWKGPIGEFTLRIEKETPHQITSLCFPGKPKKISPTVFELYQKDFVPPDKLVVYFYMVGPEARDPHFPPSPVLEQSQRKRAVHSN
jgi:hypothetical protein